MVRFPGILSSFVEDCGWDCENFIGCLGLEPWTQLLQQESAVTQSFLAYSGYEIAGAWELVL